MGAQPSGAAGTWGRPTCWEARLRGAGVGVRSAEEDSGWPREGTALPDTGEVYLAFAAFTLES